MSNPGQNIKRLRQERGWTARKLAELADTDQPNITRVEKGQRPRTELEKRLAVALGVDVVDFYKDPHELELVINQFASVPVLTDAEIGTRSTPERVTGVDTPVSDRAVAVQVVGDSMLVHGPKGPSLTNPGQKIKHLRLVRGWTATKLAELADTNSPNISRIENGQQRPRTDLEKRLAEVLGVDVGDFYKDAVELNEASHQVKTVPIFTHAQIGTSTAPEKFTGTDSAVSDKAFAVYVGA